MAKNKKVPTGKQAKKMGYTSFSQDTFETGDTTNARAYDLFLQMLNVPKKVQKKVAKGKEHKVNEGDYYPVTLEETLQMEDLLNQSSEAVTDRSDTVLMDALAEMRGIIDWSKTRQWNFNWGIIAGVFLFVCFLWYNASKAKEGVENQKATLALIEKGDAAVLDKHKADLLRRDSTSIHYSMSSIAGYKKELDSENLDKSQKKEYANRIKGYEKDIAKKQERIDKLKAADMDGAQKILVQAHKKDLKSAKRERRSKVMSTLFWLLLIPLYVVAERPYGYMISKNRLESRILGWIRKAMFWLAGGLFAGAAALQVTETVTTWSDGSKTSDNDAMPILFLKCLLIGAAAIIFVFTSIALMIYSTISGLIRNYDLKSEAQNLIAKLKK
ncbi:MAG: hypothetical protein FWF09_06825 [Bacteroidales bacterium]|nr:hypothetical protein [Bacteroidales bacterium]